MRLNANIAMALDVVITALVPIVWGTTYWVTTELLPEGLPITAATIRTLPAGVILIVLSRSFVPAIPWGRMILLSLLNIAAFQALLFIAAYRLPGGIAAITGAFQPIIVLGLVWLLDRQRPSRFVWIIASSSIIGMAVMFGRHEQSWDLIGLAAAFGGTGCMAVGVYLSRRWNAGAGLLGFTGWQLFLGGLMLLPFAWFLEPALPVLTRSNWYGYAYLCIVGTLLAYALWFRGVTRLPSVAVSSLGLLSPVTAVLIGWLLLGESMGIRSIIGLVIVLSAVLALQWQVGNFSSPKASLAACQR
jgi:probable blue pigment (indigoidine) exporter